MFEQLNITPKYIVSSVRNKTIAQTKHLFEGLVEKRSFEFFRNSKAVLNKNLVEANRSLV